MIIINPKTTRLLIPTSDEGNWCLKRKTDTSIKKQLTYSQEIAKKLLFKKNTLRNQKLLNEEILHTHHQYKPSKKQQSTALMLGDDNC